MTYVRPELEGGTSGRGFFGFLLGTIFGLIVGAAGGAYSMYIATVSALPTAVDAVARGMAVTEMQRAREATPEQPPSREPANAPGAEPPPP